MSNLTTTNIQLPAHLADRMGTPSSISGSMTSGIHSGGFKRISIRGGRFRIKDGSDETILPDSVMRAVIVGANPALVKTFYKGAFNPKAEDKSPDCYSNDGVKPAADAKDPQAQQCANCPQNEWGSKVSDNNVRMKACSDQKRVAIIAANDTSAEPEVFLFQVTPASLNDFRKYGQLLESKGFPPEICVTEIYFDADEAFPKAQFRFGGFVGEDMLPAVDKLLGSATVREVTGETTATAKVVEKSTPKPSPVKQAKPVQEIEDAEFEEVQVPIAVPAGSGGFGFGGAKPVANNSGFGGAKPAANAMAREPGPAVTAQSSNLKNDIQDILNSMRED